MTVAAGRHRSRLLVLLVAAALAALLSCAAPARSQTTLVGIDVSNWQHEIDWLRVKGTGVDFVYAKAAEGTTFTDLTFAINREGAKGMGIRFGAYHYARPGGSSDAAAVASAVAQADHFLAVAQPVQGELLPALDLEERGGLSVARLTLWVQAWLAEVTARTGLKPVIYVSPNFWKTYVGDSTVAATAGNPLWIAHWTRAALPILPGASWGGFGWTFWQWSSCRKIAGIAGCVDGDRFNGATLAKAVVPGFPAGAPVKGTAPTIVGVPQGGKLLAALPGAWTGGKPVAFSYQWQRCAVNGSSCMAIPGATAASYVPLATDVGRPLRLVVTASGAGGAASSASALTLAVAAGGAPVGVAPKPTKPPTITGLLEAGQVLTAGRGTWTGAPTSYAYQWLRCTVDGQNCATVVGSGATYTITPGDIASSLVLTVTAVGKGGAGSAKAAPTVAVAAAPLPAAAVGSAVAQAGQAGAVTTTGGIALASWQPGVLPAQATVTLAETPSRLALPATSVRLGVTAASPLAWPVDVAYGNAPAGSVPGILPLAGVWQPLAELPAPALPADQQAGAYRDPAGTLHVLTRTPGRIALFAAGKWGDPRYATALRPRLTTVNAATLDRAGNGGGVLLARITLDTQAHLYVSLLGPGRKPLLLPQKGARIGWWLQGAPAKTLQALQLSPGALPLRLHIPAAQLKRGGATLTLRIAALDPYGRRSVLTVRVGGA